MPNPLSRVTQTAFTPCGTAEPKAISSGCAPFTLPNHTNSTSGRRCRKQWMPHSHKPFLTERKPRENRCNRSRLLYRVVGGSSKLLFYHANVDKPAGCVRGKCAAAREPTHRNNQLSLTGSLADFYLITVSKFYSLSRNDRILIGLLKRRRERICQKMCYENGEDFGLET